mmetsp:Transcript_14038/g.22928  ORF Transcript_14038/g.22928 Transcript_14038/m.22928 type:complete len:289 (+) Transcript_14038:140-1006(+)|eukprot:CAMPEP_0203774810 /NCGR_PEP_ID=MMETSP0099_2-20121227/5613_1 /ASSEMBLY_ACC=CAM_ASM_000209 /TAXON_ID=96639 /ORGANISM=" , Strain NY0313808BC1" /LENGTH=288 /DNA_ID=CAMNT_0050673179 /DNA_START=292 /DNA_END=1158 /DNA_ORIENTATION=-
MTESFLLYRDDGSTQEYVPKSIRFKLGNDGVAVVTNCVPEMYHPLTKNFRCETFAVLEHCKRCKDVKVLVWTAEGEKAFCSGAALKPMPDVHIPEEIIQEYFNRGMAPDAKDLAYSRESHAFWDFPKPAICAVNGLAVGGGANFALSNYFDIVLCSTNARFKYPFADLGFTPELSSSLVLPFTIGMVRTKKLMFSGEWFSAQDAKDWGLVNEIYQPKELLPKTLELAGLLASKPQPQLMLSKKLLNHQLRRQLDETTLLENEAITSSLHNYGGKYLLMGKSRKKKSNL